MTKACRGTRQTASSVTRALSNLFSFTPASNILYDIIGTPQTSDSEQSVPQTKRKWTRTDHSDSDQEVLPRSGSTTDRESKS